MKVSLHYLILGITCLATIFAALLLYNHSKIDCSFTPFGHTSQSCSTLTHNCEAPAYIYKEITKQNDLFGTLRVICAWSEGTSEVGYTGFALSLISLLMFAQKNLKGILGSLAIVFGIGALTALGIAFQMMYFGLSLSTNLYDDPKNGSYIFVPYVLNAALVLFVFCVLLVFVVKTYNKSLEEVKEKDKKDSVPFPENIQGHAPLISQ